MPRPANANALQGRGASPGWGAPALALLACLGCDPFHTGFDDVEPAERYRAREITPAPEDPSELVIMTYNVKFGGGRIDFFFDCHGDRVLMEKSEVIENLEGLAREIRQVSPDVLFLQEADINSKRSAFVNQVRWLLDHTELNYGVYASQWRADYVPSDGIGAVDSGNAILSRYPLRGGTRIALPLRTDQDAVTRYFYLRRNLLRAEVLLGERSLWLVTLHADAYGKDGTKRKHIERLLGELDARSGDGELVVGGGDLNAIPPGSVQTHGFSDSVCKNEDYQADDYRGEEHYLDTLYDRYQAAIPLDEYQRDNALYFSHTTSKDDFWNRKLDYLFTSGWFVPGSGLVHQAEERGGIETMPLSDHAPVSVRLELP